MKFLDEQIFETFESAGFDINQLRKAQRVAGVRNLWKQLVEQPILDHTNGVFVFHNDDRLEMHVYVDDSIFASEVFNRKSMIFHECRLKYNEAIDDIYVHVSQGKWKNNYPFREDTHELPDQNNPVPLSEEELEMVEEACAHIEDEALRTQFRSAMISDLEWKKGNK